MTDNKPIRAAIVSNGQMSDPETAYQRLQDVDYIVCADGGARHVVEVGLVPDVVIGDFDSITPELLTGLTAAGVRLERYPVRKDETDLELALGFTVSQGFEDIDLLAVAGGRLDQTLANVLLLAQAKWESARIRIVEGNETAWVARGGATPNVVAGTIGDTLSLVPLTPQVHGVNLEGVEWPLHNSTLHFGSTLTISNTMTADIARLWFGDGMVLVVHCSSL